MYFFCVYHNECCCMNNSDFQGIRLAYFYNLIEAQEFLIDFANVQPSFLFDRFEFSAYNRHKCILVLREVIVE